MVKTRNPKTGRENPSIEHVESEICTKEHLETVVSLMIEIRTVINMSFARVIPI